MSKFELGQGVKFSDSQTPKNMPGPPSSKNPPVRNKIMKIKTKIEYAYFDHLTFQDDSNYIQIKKDPSGRCKPGDLVEILPCPFHEQLNEGKNLDFGGHSYYIHCLDCDAEGPWEDIETVVFEGKTYRELEFGLCQLLTMYEIIDRWNIRRGVSDGS